MATVPQISDVYPAPNSLGIPIGDQIRVIFNQEMDLDSINTGTFVLVGPDEAPLFGPADITPFDEPGFDDENILSSPYFKGYVTGTISFSKIDASGGLVLDSVKDTAGSGDLWRTVAIFTPSKPLKANVEYKCIILGDEAPDDDFDTGVMTRTVFDTIFTGSGTGRLAFKGGYTGANARTYTIEITTGGSTGDAEYIWWEATDPLTTYSGITSTGARELEDGIYVLCEPDGSFTVGDKFEVVVVPGSVLTNNYSWTFNTGSGSILTPPSSNSTSGIDSLVTSNVAGGLKVVDISPADKSSNLAPDNFATIIITFNKDIDTNTINQNTVKLWSESVNGDSSIRATGVLARILSVDGNKLVVQIPSGS